MNVAHRQVSAVLAVIALAIAPVSSSLHLVAVAHDVCAEHGEVVHGEHPDEHGAVHEATEDRSTVTGGGTHADPHDHGCVLLASLWTQPLPAHYAVSTVAPCHCGSDTSVAAHQSFATGDVLAWAPKQSPPIRLSA